MCTELGGSSSCWWGPQTRLASDDAQPDAQQAATNVMNAAKEAWQINDKEGYRDDISVLVAYLPVQPATTAGVPATKSTTASENPAYEVPYDERV